jgi:hypothetical protein
VGVFGDCAQSMEHHPIEHHPIQYFSHIEAKRSGAEQ